MTLCLLLCVLCLMAPVGYSQPPGQACPRGSPGPPGYPGRPGAFGQAGHAGSPGPPGPSVMCGQDLPDFIDHDLEAFKKRLSKLELTVNYSFFRKVGQKYFVSNKERGSFSLAIEFCSQQDLKLALPENEEENGALTQLFGEVDKMVWINVSDKKAEGNFETDMKNRPLTFTKWGEGQPNKSLGDTGCTMLSGNGVWRVSQDCSLNAYIICQI